MDDVNVAASIVGIATTGTKVSIKVVTLASQVSTKADRISSVGNDVSLTSSVLHQLGDLMGQKTIGGGLLPVFSKAGLESIESSAEVCRKIFEEVERETAKANRMIGERKGPMGGKVKLKRGEKRKWPFLQPSIEVLRTELKEAKDTLMLMLQLASLALSKRAADLNTSAPPTMTEQRDIIRSVLILKRQQQQNDDSNSDGDAEVFEDREKRPAETMRELEEKTTQRPTSLTQPSGSSTSISRSPAAKPAGVTDREDHPPERPKALSAEMDVDVPTGSDTSTADDWSQTASEYVLLSRTNSNNHPPQRSPLKTQSLQAQETATDPGIPHKAEGVKLRLFTINPVITVKYAQIHIDWRAQSARIPQREIHNLVAQHRASGFESVLATLDALHVWERTLISNSIDGFPDHVTLVSLKRTEHDRREGNVALNGVPSFQLITEQPACDTSEVPLSRPTYVKVARWHVCPETLDAYGLPWVWDDRNLDYIIIERWLPECDQDILFEHTRLLRERKRRRYSPSEGERSAQEEDDDSTTGYHARKKSKKNKITGTEEAEDEAGEKAAVDELLEKYTTVFS